MRQKSRASDGRSGGIGDDKAEWHRTRELIERHSDIGVAIADQAMPQMTGLQLAATIAESRPNLPVIIATGYTDLKGTGLGLSMVQGMVEQSGVRRGAGRTRVGRIAR